MIKFDKKYIDGLSHVLNGSEFGNWLGITSNIDYNKTTNNIDYYNLHVLNQILDIVLKYPMVEFIYVNEQGMVIPTDGLDVYNRNIPLMSVLKVSTPEIMSVVRDIKLDQIL